MPANEALKPGSYYIDPEECIGCRGCGKVCPQDCIDYRCVSGRIQQERCVRCGQCAGVCPVGAIRRTAP